MTTDTGIVQLEEATSDALQKAFDGVRRQAAPTSVALPKSHAAPKRSGEVLVLVLGPESGLVAKFAVAGRTVDMRELRLRFFGAEVAVDHLAGEPLAPKLQLTDAEAAALQAVGLVEGSGGEPSAIEKSRIEYELMAKDSPTLDKVAKTLGVNASRLRQRLAVGTLYGFKDGRSWRIPKFQLDPKRRKLVRGIEKVLPSLRQGAHPLAVVTWFSRPHQDLVVGEEEVPVSPVQWLASGGSPSIVAELAKEI